MADDRSRRARLSGRIRISAGILMLALASGGVARVVPGAGDQDRPQSRSPGSTSQPAKAAVPVAPAPIPGLLSQPDHPQEGEGLTLERAIDRGMRRLATRQDQE
jgi:hypothetical protein